jgi:streptomycin 6-kinase
MLEADAVLGVMLLERLQPGKTLVELGDDREATGIAIAVMRQLWQPAPERHPFPTVAKWAAGMGRMRVYFDGGTGPFPRRLVELAESLFAELIPSMEAAVLLHGDLHHGNILSAQRHPWLALDPKGVVGEPAYEVGAFLRNPSPQPRRIQAWRVDQFSAELGLDRERVIGWGVAQAVLSAWWSIEDHGHGWEPAIETATVLSELLR